MLGIKIKIFQNDLFMTKKDIFMMRKRTQRAYEKRRDKKKIKGK